MKKIVVPALLFFFVLVAMVFLPPFPIGGLADNLEKEINSLKAALPLGFGGRILAVTSCTCSGGLRLEIGPPRPMDLWYQPGVSTLFSFYSLLPSEYVLGIYVPGGACTIGSAPYCVPVPTLGTLTIAGTSLLPLLPSI